MIQLNEHNGLNNQLNDAKFQCSLWKCPAALNSLPADEEKNGFGVVSPKQLAVYMQRCKNWCRDLNIIILDTREMRKYHEEHIVTAKSVNCSTKTMAKLALNHWNEWFSSCNGCPAPKYENTPLDCDTTSDVDMECDFLNAMACSVIIYDQNTFIRSAANLPDSSPIDFLVKTLNGYGNRILFLDGGFEAFKAMPFVTDFIDSGLNVANVAFTATTGSCQHQPTQQPAGGDLADRDESQQDILLHTYPPKSGKRHFMMRLHKPIMITALQSSALVSSRPSLNSCGSLKSDEDLYATCNDILGAKVSLILPKFYLGNERDAQDRNLLKELGVTHIVNVTDEAPMPFKDELVYLHLPAIDNTQQNLRSIFDKAFDFIDGARKSMGTVLVHCHAGVSRSVAVVMSYLMRLDPKLTALKALERVQATRPIAGPNLNFMGQLELFHADLNRSKFLPSLTSGSLDSLSFSASMMGNNLDAFKRQEDCNSPPLNSPLSSTSESSDRLAVSSPFGQ